MEKVSLIKKKWVGNQVYADSDHPSTPQVACYALNNMFTYSSRLFLSKSSRFSPKIGGFTLIELLVVIVIMGVISAIALPTLIKQVEKAREVDARKTLGVINRAQQEYQFEYGTFGQTFQDINLSLSDSPFYDFQILPGASRTAVHQLATPKPAYTNDLKKIAGSLFKQGSIVSLVLCEANNPGDTPVIVDQNTCNNGKIFYKSN